MPVSSNPPRISSGRGDATRNREKLLNIAAQMIQERGVGCLTMDGLAERAKVGKGTIFRHFGSRSGLLESLLDHTEEDFQRQLIFGPPPLGPGASAKQRLLAFGKAVIDRFEVNGELVQAARESSDRRFSAPAAQLHRMHVMILLRAAEAEAATAQSPAAPSTQPADVELLAYVLLAALEPGLLSYHRRVAGISPERQGALWGYLLERLLPEAP
nr:TetR/AcrR family transcriptional regulator [Psychromicrobium silvestre]